MAGRWRRFFGRLAAGGGLLGAIGGTAAFLVSGDAGAPSGSDMLTALGEAMRAEAARSEEEGAALGARLDFTPPARLTAELIDARMVRELVSVERIDCEAVDEGVFHCAYVARGEARCEGAGCDVFGGVGATPIEERAHAMFVSAGLGTWRVRPAAAESGEQ